MHENKYPSLKKLSETFEISYRQGQRDIEYMRDFLGAPIEYSAKNKGYFYSGDFSMPTIYLSDDEINYIKKLSDYYNNLQDNGLNEYKKYGEMFNYEDSLLSSYRSGDFIINRRFWSLHEFKIVNLHNHDIG